MGAKERETAYKKRCDEIRQEYGNNDKELAELRVEFAALQGKHGEVILNYKNKLKQFEDQGEALDKIEKQREQLSEENKRLNIQCDHFEKEVKDREMMVSIEKENMTKTRYKLIQLEKDYDNLNAKQNTAREILQTENYELKHELSILKEKLDIFKNSRHHWIKNIDNETHEHDLTRTQLQNHKL